MPISSLSDHTFDTLLVGRDGPIVTITLNRPEAANGINMALARDLADVAMRCDQDPSIKAVILTSQGRFFCAGGDVKSMITFGDEVGMGLKNLADCLHRALSSFARMQAPLIVAVNGVTAGAGVSAAAAGDIVIAAESASFTMAYTGVGLSPDGGSTYLLPRLIGLRRTQELMFTNRRLSAAQALDWGLVTSVVADDQLQAEALRMATIFANGSAGSNAAVKRLLLDTFHNGFEAQMELEGRAIAACAASDDGREGVAAFVDKRPARFNGAV